MSEQITLTVNGIQVSVPRGTTVAVAVLLAGAICRHSVTDEPRAPLCGMGVCYECRVKIDDVSHCRGCQTLCEHGMNVRTDD